MPEIFIYRTYGSSKNGDPVTEGLIEAAEKEKLSKQSGILSELTGLGRSTIHNLLVLRKTRYPRHTTIAALYGALGYELEPKRKGKFDLEAERADARRWQIQKQRQKLAAMERREANRTKNGNKGSPKAEANA